MGGRASKVWMRLLPTSLLLLTLARAGAQAPPGVRVPASPTPTTRDRAAQAPAAARIASSPTPTAPTVGVIDYYGLNRVTRDRIQKTLGFKEGDPFPASK